MMDIAIAYIDPLAINVHLQFLGIDIGHSCSCNRLSCY